MNYSELKTQVSNYIERDDVIGQIPTFISLAESWMFRELHVKDLQTSATLTTTGEYASLPADFLSAVKVTATSNGVTYSLDYQNDPDVYTGVNITPDKYAFQNGQIRIVGASTGQQVTLYYTPKVTALSDSNTTNWVIDNAQDLYLYSSCLEAARYTRNAQLMQTLEPLVMSSLEATKRFIERRGMPSAGSMQIKVR